MLRGLKYEYQVQMCVQAVDSHEFDLIVGERVSFKSSVKNSGVGFVQRNHYGGVMDCNSAIVCVRRNLHNSWIIQDTTRMLGKIFVLSPFVVELICYLLQ